MSYKRPSFQQMMLHDSIRTRMYSNGLESLSDAEVLTIILHTSKYDTPGMAKLILDTVNNDLNMLAKSSVDDLMAVKGIGPVKAERIAATFELGRRRALSGVTKRTQIMKSEDIYDLMKSRLGDINHEEFWVIYLNTKHYIIDCIRVSHGGVSQTTVDPKIILSKALLLLASAIVMVHNHPSNSSYPSDCDDAITMKVKAACKNLDIQLTDHLIFSESSYYSYQDEGKLG